MQTDIEILIVEDSPTQAERLKHTLEQHRYAVAVTVNGKEALAAIRRRKPALVISDIMMPEMDGYELCRQVRKDADIADVPVILLTSLADAKDVLQSLECGAHHFITKPYDEEELFSRIEYVLSNRMIRKGKRVDIGLEIYFAGQKYYVSSEHMQILDLLLSTYEAAVRKNQVANKATDELRTLNEQLEDKVKARTAALTAEIAQRERVEEELLFKNALLEAQSETTIDGILVVDESARTILFNGRFADMWGVPREVLETGDDEKVLQSVTGQVCDPQSFLAKVKELYSHRDEKSRDEIELKGGRCFDRYSSPLVDRNGKYCGRIWYFRDITERKQAELALRRVNRALKVTSDCNQVLIRATEESALLNDVCRVLVAVGGYDSAWVGFVEQNPERLGPPVAHAGSGKELAMFAEGALDSEESKHRPASVAIRTGKPCVMQCAGNECDLNPWQVQMRGAGYASAAAFPLFIQRRVMGVLSMYAKNAETFAADEMRLLAEMADDLAFGIQTIRTRAAHTEAVETLRENEERYHHLFESLYDAAFLADGKTGIILDANRQAEVLLGKSRNEIIGSHQSELHPPAHAQAYRESFTVATEHANSVTEADVVRKDGTIVPVSISTSNLTVGGAPLALGLFRDISEAKHAERSLKASAVKLHRMMEGSIKAMGSALEARDPYTAGHERRVAQLAFAIAGEMGLDEGTSEGIRIAGYVHDIGKIAVPAEILSKPGQISAFEYGIIKIHPQSGHDILKEIDFVWPVALTTLQHHERLDGSGYPQGLKGDGIIPEARILAVADVVEAMSSHRPYRAALGIARALDEITQKKGVLYDPLAVDACVRLFRQKEFKFE